MAKTTKKAEEPQLPALTADPDGWRAALEAAGFVNPASGGATTPRLNVKGTAIYLGDDIIAEYSQVTKEPALYVQLTKVPAQLQALYFDKRENANDPQSNGMLASALGRDGSIQGVPSIEGRFCRSYFEKEDEARHHSEDGTNCNTCPVMPFVPKNKLPPEARGKKCSWRAEVEFRILAKQEDGTLAANDDNIYMMNLPTTSVIEFFGSGGNNRSIEGTVSEEHTMAAIAHLGYDKWGAEGIAKAKTLLDLGGVICGIHLPQMKNDESNRTWTVISFRPIDIVEEVEYQALPDSSANAGDGTLENESVPF